MEEVHRVADGDLVALLLGHTDDICQALEELMGLEDLKRGGPVRQFFKEAIGYRAQKADDASETARGSRQVREPSAR